MPVSNYRSVFIRCSPRFLLMRVEPHIIGTGRRAAQPDDRYHEATGQSRLFKKNSTTARAPAISVAVGRKQFRDKTVQPGQTPTSISNPPLVSSFTESAIKERFRGHFCRINCRFTMNKSIQIKAVLNRNRHRRHIDINNTDKKKNGSSKLVYRMVSFGGWSNKLYL